MKIYHPHMPDRALVCRLTDPDLSHLYDVSSLEVIRGKPGSVGFVHGHVRSGLSAFCRSLCSQGFVIVDLAHREVPSLSPSLLGYFSSLGSHLIAVPYEYSDVVSMPVWQPDSPHMQLLPTVDLYARSLRSHRTSPDVPNVQYVSLARAYDSFICTYGSALCREWLPVELSSREQIFDEAVPFVARNLQRDMPAGVLQ